MMKANQRDLPITTLLLVIDGVLPTNWRDHLARRRAAKHFGLEWPEMEGRHALIFATHEEEKLPKPYSEMIELIAQLKVRHGLKIAVVSNEAREVSPFVHLRKLDPDIFRLALDIAQTGPPGRGGFWAPQHPSYGQVHRRETGFVRTDERRGPT